VIATFLPIVVVGDGRRGLVGALDGLVGRRRLDLGGALRRAFRLVRALVRSFGPALCPGNDAAAGFSPASIPPLVERSDWEISALEPPGRIAVPATVQGLLWTSGLAEKRGPANSGASPANPAPEGTP